MFASSLLILFSSNSLALAFLRSAMNWTSPRILELFPELPRLRKPPDVDELMFALMLVLQGARDEFCPLRSQVPLIRVRCW
jgi:hypothetical protein